MADQERKKDAEKHDQDAEDEASEAKAQGEKSSGKTSAEASTDADERDASDADDEPDDGAAERIAKALGVAHGGPDGEGEGEGDEEAAKAKDAEAPAPAPNRAARRREEAMERRKKRAKGAEGAAPKLESAEDEAREALPRDKNARSKELLKRRREQASAPRPIQLLPSEMVDDALARSTSAAGKWFRDNFGKIQWVILAALVGVSGYAIYTSQIEKTAAAATGTLFTGVASELGRVVAEDKRSDDDKEMDATRVFKTADERNEAALAGYRKAMAENPGKAVGQLAKLGEAGVLLDKHDWPGAIDAYSAVLASKLASVDIDVKGRAIEGLGLAKEGKGDLDGALAAFKDLEGIDARGYKELAMFQQGRLLLTKGDKDKAKELLKQVRDKLQTNGEASAFLYLQSSVDEALGRIDPSLVPSKSVMGGQKGNAMSPDQIEKIKRMFDDAAKKKANEEH